MPFSPCTVTGQPGRRYTKRDALGREVKAYEMKSVPALNGKKVYLTIDQYLQYVTERALDRAYRTWHAKGAQAVMIEADTGRILAMANRPTTDVMKGPPVTEMMPRGYAGAGGAPAPRGDDYKGR